jgi:hypothetical protein
MKDCLFEGSLAETPFPKLLFVLWQREATGRLLLRERTSEIRFFFEKGDLLIDKGSFPEKDFLKALVKKKVLPAESARRCEKHAAEADVSLLRALGELGLVPPLPLWNLMESFFVRQLFPLFTRTEGTFSSEPGIPLADGERLGVLPTPDLILHGIRQIQDGDLLERLLPDENGPIYVSSPHFLHRLGFEPHERYALALLQRSPNLKSFYERSELGREQGRKVLFALACFDILAAPEKDPQNRPAGEGSAGAEAVLEALNEKCAFVHKYITKKIGPLAHTILGNSLEEARSHLGPVFQKTRLLADGRVEIDPALEATASHLPEELYRTLLQGFDEILMAEVLAVKKSLGPVHESTLVRALEKVGCL